MRLEFRHLRPVTVCHIVTESTWFAAGLANSNNHTESTKAASVNRFPSRTHETVTTPVSITGQIEVDGQSYTIAVRDDQPVIADAEGNPLTQEQVTELRNQVEALDVANQQMTFTNVERNGTAMPDATALALEVMDTQGRIQLSQATPNAGQGQGTGR